MPTPRKSSPPAITDPAAAADHRERLEALRDRLTAAAEVATDRNLAPIARSLQAVLDALAQLPEASPADPIAALQAKAAARLAGVPTAPRRTVRGRRD